jgi:hypothetical protein
MGLICECQSKQWIHTHSPNKPKKFTQMVSVRQKDVTGQERSADGGIHATKDHNVTSVLRNTKKLCRAIQNKRHGVFLHESLHLHAAACTWALLQHFNWELFDDPPYSPYLALSDCHLFTYMKNCLRSQHYNIMRSWWKASKHGFAHRQQTSLAQVYKNLFPDMTSASVPVVTPLRSSLSMCVFFCK